MATTLDTSTDNTAVRQTVPVQALTTVAIRNVALSWQQTTALTAVLVAAALLAQLRTPRAAAVLRECALISGLYTVWQYAGEWSLPHAGDAFARARWIVRFEHDLGLPGEASVQRLVVNHSALIQAANYYYATMHFATLFAFLIWLYFRHRDQYRPIRRVLALTTLVCLLIQLFPVAPPRLLPGFVDTAVEHGQSVYGLGFGADQLSAMPSVHVAWAVLIGVAAARVSTSHWRWLGAAHAVLTVLVVVITANHFWLDGVVASLVLAACWAAERVVHVVLTRRRSTLDSDLNRVPDASILG